MQFTDVWPIKPMADQRAVVQGAGYRITVLTDRLLRLEYDPENAFCDTATQTVVCREFPVPEFTVTEKEHLLTIETKSLRLQYDKKPFSQTGLQVTLKGQFANYASIWHYGDEPETLKGTARTLDRADGAIPLEEGLMSVKGYAALDDSHCMRMDETGRLLPAKAHGIDLYLFGYGHDYNGCLRDFLRLSGKTPPLPRYALGNWWSRFYPYTQVSFKALMERFIAEGVPLSVSVLDMNWHVTDIDPKYGPGWTGYTWDRKKFPEPEKLLSWLHEQGLRVTLNDHPADGVRACEEMYPQMAEAMGEDPARGKPFPFDAADEKYQKAFEKCVLEPYERMGVDFWWIDWQQKGGSTDPSIDPLFVLNHTRYVHALESGNPAMTFSRYAGPGSHRYPIGFSGDSFATWASLAFQPYFTSTAANIGYGWWSHDIGGHMHGAKDDELSVRWLQFGVFSPIMRLHSSPNSFMRKEPWKYPLEVCGIMKDYMRLRHRMLPWLYTQNILASEGLGALLRPLYYDYPQERLLYFVCRNQYLLGDSLMVCPITEHSDAKTHLASAEVFLPEGEWYDFFSGACYQGKQRIKMYRHLSDMPVLAKAGAILPMNAEEIPGNGAALPETVLLRVFVGENGDAELIEDNGRMPGAQDYKRITTRFALRQDGSLRFEIAKPEGDASLLPASRRYIVELCGMPETIPGAASCAYAASYDAKKRALRLVLEAGAQDGAVIEWTNAPECPAYDWLGRLREVMTPAEMDFDQKEMIIRMAQGCRDSVALLAQLHTFDLPQPLFGAVLELLSIR